MRRQHIRTKGFTLIELLVVIAIIAILIGLLFPAMQQALANAKKTKVRSEIKSIENAVQAYFNEYSKLPAPDAWQGQSPDKVCELPADSVQVINRLTTNNSRKIVFLDVPSGLTDGTFLDPWKTQYAVVLDTDYDGLTQQGTNKVLSQSFAYSAGPDKNFTTTNDNIYTVR